jgi:hypothetical protein
MAKLAKALSQTGFLPINMRYASTRHSIETLSEAAINAGLARCPHQSKIHFVTHSLGSILVRHYLSANIIENLGRVVMLAPPNKGSQVVDKLYKVPGFRLINGPAGLQVGTDAPSVPNRLGPAHFELGIIAGTRSINLILSAMLPNPNDGRVSVENTKLEGMTDHLALPVTHPFIMKNEKVILQVIHFLKNGVFERP